MNCSGVTITSRRLWRGIAAAERPLRVSTAPRVRARPAPQGLCRPSADDGFLSLASVLRLPRGDRSVPGTAFPHGLGFVLLNQMHNFDFSALSFRE